MSDFTYQELDDLDSAVADSLWRFDHQTDDLDEEDEAHYERLKVLRDRVLRLMAEFPRRSLLPYTEPQ